MKEIKFAVPENGEKLLTNVSELHDELLKLPAHMYVDLFRMMKAKMDNSHYASNGFISARTSCCCYGI